jgi:hypothetical protein
MGPSRLAMGRGATQTVRRCFVCFVWGITREMYRGASEWQHHPRLTAPAWRSAYESGMRQRSTAPLYLRVPSMHVTGLAQELGQL